MFQHKNMDKQKDKQDMFWRNDIVKHLILHDHAPKLCAYCPGPTLTLAYTPFTCRVPMLISSY